MLLDVDDWLVFLFAAAKSRPGRAAVIQSCSGGGMMRFGSTHPELVLSERGAVAMRAFCGIR